MRPDLQLHHRNDVWEGKSSKASLGNERTLMRNNQNETYGSHRELDNCQPTQPTDIITAKNKTSHRDCQASEKGEISVGSVHVSGVWKWVEESSPHQHSWPRSETPTRCWMKLPLPILRAHRANGNDNFARGHRQYCSSELFWDRMYFFEDISAILFQSEWMRVLLWGQQNQGIVGKSFVRE